MKLEKIHIKGFRNFDDVEVYLQEKTLIIGANDVGKSNLLYAFRLLFDKTLSENDLELNDSDFNVYSNATSIEISVYLCDVFEDCLISMFAGALKDGITIIRFIKEKKNSYRLFWGYSEQTLIEIPSRLYLKRLNMQYLDANRNLLFFMNKERSKILSFSKDNRDAAAIDKDACLIEEIQSGINDINKKVSSLSYVKSSLNTVNEELSKLSIHNEDQEVKFVSGDSNANNLLNNLVLSYSTDNGPLKIGGDGRNNQIFLATWLAKQKKQNNIDHVTFYAIEEPEAHLHPHQQRKLSEYIQNYLDSTVFITTHSPQIVCRFDPANLVRLYSRNKNSYAACGGSSPIIKKLFTDFGYRLNTISSEIFFSDGVFLVEGVSEVLFYTAVSKALGLDLERYNISILPVEGVGFKPYIKICLALNIPWVLRTDNDIFEKSNNSQKIYYYSGLTRALGIIYELNNEVNELSNYWEKNKQYTEWLNTEEPPIKAVEINKNIRSKLEYYGIFLSNIDLENDLVTTPLIVALEKHYKKKGKDLVKKMQSKKAENMLDFINCNNRELKVLENDPFLAPVRELFNKVSERIRPNVDNRTNR